MMKNLCLSIVVLLALTLPALAQDQAVLQTEAAQSAWREDVQYMAGQMQAIHPNLYWRISGSSALYVESNAPWR